VTSINPIENWLFATELELTPGHRKQLRARARSFLDELSSYLDNPPEHADLRDAVGGLRGWNYALQLPESDIARAQDLFRRVFRSGGDGTRYAQEALLSLLALSLDRANIPFWKTIVAYERKPQDPFKSRRIEMAAAALALLVIHRAGPEPEGTLRELASHPNPEVRAQALHSLGQAYLISGRSLPEELTAELYRVSAEDPAFEPRFLARSILRRDGREIPNDIPGGAYVFKVIWKPAIYRTVELRSEQTLKDLHEAIQQGYRWEGDHLYSFFLNGVLWDDRYGFASPHEQDNPPWTDEAILGELGLLPHHQFVYIFDYSEGHEFDVRVVDIRPQAEKGDYPRVVVSRGATPDQLG
jgi:hypothetical protein